MLVEFKVPDNQADLERTSVIRDTLFGLGTARVTPPTTAESPAEQAVVDPPDNATIPPHLNSPSAAPAASGLAGELAAFAQGTTLPPGGKSVARAVGKLPRFGPALEAVLTGAPGRYPAANGDSIEVATVQAWAVAFARNCLDPLCEAHFEALTSGNRSEAEALIHYLQSLVDQVLSKLPKTAYLEFVLPLKPLEFDPQQMTAVGSLPNAGASTTVRAMRAAGVMHGLKALQSARVIFG